MSRMMRWGLLVLGLMMSLWSGSAKAEAQYGYQTATLAVSATARVNVSVNVPRIILLRVGASNTTIDTVTFSMTASIPATPTTATVGNNQNVNWDGTSVPTFSSGTSDLAAAAWTNVASATLSCSVAAFAPAGGPVNTALTATDVTPAGLTHPVCGYPGAGTPTAIAAFGVVKTSTFRYTLSGAGASTWAPGSYSTQVTYTASAP